MGHMVEASVAFWTIGRSRGCGDRTGQGPGILCGRYRSEEGGRNSWWTICLGTQMQSLCKVLRGTDGCLWWSSSGPAIKALIFFLWVHLLCFVIRRWPQLLSLWRNGLGLIRELPRKPLPAPCSGRERGCRDGRGLRDGQRDLKAACLVLSIQHVMRIL